MKPSQVHFLQMLAEIKDNPPTFDTPSQNSRVLIVDGLNTFIRAHSVSPVTNDNGTHMGGITGFLLSVGAACKLLRPTRLIITFDGRGGSTRRRKLFSEYKMKRAVKTNLNRPEFSNLTPDQEENGQIRQLVRLGDYLTILPITLMVEDGIEADDTIAYVTKQLLAKKDEDKSASKVFIMSADRDFLQLVNEDIQVWSPTKKKLYTPATLHEEYGILPANFLLYRAITGDKADDIPGVPGIQITTLLNLFPDFGKELITFESLMETCGVLVQSKKVSKKIQAIYENQAIIERNLKLMQLADVDIATASKRRIQAMFRAPYTRSQKLPFIKLLVDDGIEGAIKNLDLWLREVFAPLDTYATK